MDTKFKDAKLNDFIRLKQVPAAPVERWQMIPTVRYSASAVGEKKPGVQKPSSPLKQIPSNIQSSKTPETRRMVIKTPKDKAQSKTPSNRKTPGIHKTPKSQNTPGRTVQTPSSCRFIPNRATTDVDYSSFLLRQKTKEVTSGEDKDDVNGDLSPSREEYKQSLLNALSKSRGHQQSNVLSFKATTTTTSAASSYLDYTEGAGLAYRSHNKSGTRSTHQFPTAPEKILDAPTLKDDYYLNLLDWGKNNLVAIGLGDGVYLWNATDGSAHQLTELKGEDNYVTSVAWSGNGKYLAIGDSQANLHLWDMTKEKKIRTMKGHSARIGALSWNKHTIASASRDGQILYNDVRKPQHVVASSYYHKLEVCGLDWSPDGTKLASGANDNMVCIWNASNSKDPEQILRGHTAAVKAVSWCPWKFNTLVTGGGTNDKTIRFWNVFTGQCTETVDTKSQVSSLAWNKYHQQLISAHGHPRNHMMIWQYPSMTRLGTLTGHSERILHMCLSPKRSRVASASSDETLRIWQCFEKAKHDVSERSYCDESINALLHSFN